MFRRSRGAGPPLANRCHVTIVATEHRIALSPTDSGNRARRERPSLLSRRRIRRLNVASVPLLRSPFLRPEKFLKRGTRRESKGHFRRIIWMGERNGSCRSGNVLRARNSRLLRSFARIYVYHEVTTNRRPPRRRVRACNFTRPDVATRTRRRRNDWTISAYDGVLRPSKSERSRPSCVRRPVKTGWPSWSSMVRRLVEGKT